MLRTSPTTRIHRQCQTLSHLSLSKRLQNLTHRCAFSTTPLSLESEQESRTSRPVGASQNPSSSSLPKVEGDEEKNSTVHALPGDGDTAQASDNTNNSFRTHTTTNVTHGNGGTTRSLRPIIFAPSFQFSQLLPVVPIPETSSSSDQNIETTMPPGITLTGLPPNTIRADIASALRSFGNITRIYILPDGRRADVFFSTAGCVKRALHAYAEEPLRIRGTEVTVFRKQAKMMDTPSPATPTKQGHDDGAIFVTDFPVGMTQEELLEAIEPLGKYEQFVMNPSSEYAHFIYSNKNHVEEILRVHQQVPITARGQILRIESSEDRPSLSPDSLGDAVELEKPLDPETCNAIVKELKQTVPGFTGAHDPSHVLWLASLPPHISRPGLINFWSRLGCVVQVRSSLKGYAHVEFASIEHALRAVRKVAPNGFTYRKRLLVMDFAPSALFAGAPYRAVYISGWPASNASNGRTALLRWAYDIPKITEANVLPPFRGEKYLDPRGAVLRFKTLDDARAALHTLDGRVGPGGETLHVRLSRPPTVEPNKMWQWVNRVKESMERSGGGEGEGEEACLKDEWGGFGFGTGEEERDEIERVGAARTGSRRGL